MSTRNKRTDLTDAIGDMITVILILLALLLVSAVIGSSAHQCPREKDANAKCSYFWCENYDGTGSI